MITVLISTFEVAMYEKTILDNGLRVVTSSLPNARSVCVSIYVGAGSRYEPSKTAGLSHFLEHLFFKGTERRSTPKIISETIEGIGGVLNAATDREATVYWAKVPKSHFPVALDLLIDMLKNSKFDPSEIEKERMVVLEELNMVNEYPSHRAAAILDQLMWPDNSLGRDVAGTKESVSAITRKHLLDYMGHQYVMPNMVVSVAGDIAHLEIVKIVNSLVTGWPTNKLLSLETVVNNQCEPRFKIENRKTEQAHICIGFHGLSAEDPDRFALDLLCTVLGEGMSSRLFLEVRENAGLAYDVHCSVDHLRDCGAFSVYAGVDPKKMDKAIRSIVGVLSSVKDGIPEVEMDKAREFTKGRLLLRMEDTRAVTGWLGGQELLKGNILTVNEVVEALDRIKSCELERIAGELLREENMSMSIVGPYKKGERFQELMVL
jgi:predicted Zn-dependent peptidase